MLTYEVPRKDVLSSTVGLEAEHCSEAIHPFCNKWGRFYKTVQNEKQRLGLTAEALWLASNPQLINFNKPKRTKCPKRNMPLYYRESREQIAELVNL